MTLNWKHAAQRFRAFHELCNNEVMNLTRENKELLRQIEVREQRLQEALNQRNRALAEVDELDRRLLRMVGINHDRMQDLGEARDVARHLWREYYGGKDISEKYPWIKEETN